MSGAQVCATDLASLWAARPNLLCVRSGPGGSYQIAVAPSGGGYTIAATAGGFLPGAAADGKPIFVAAGEQRGNLDIILSAGGVRIAGHVFDATGGPIHGATIRVNRLAAPHELVSTETDAAGAFSMFVAPGPATVLADAVGYVMQRSGVVAPNTDIRLRLVPGSTASGRVVAAGDGQGIAGITVKAIHPGAWAAPFAPSAVTVSDGHFTIRALPPGVYTFVAQGSGWYGTASRTYAVELAGARNDVLVAVSHAGQVRGSVVELSGGNPCREGTVSIGPTGVVSIDDPPGSRQERSRSQAPSFTDGITPSGTVHFDGVPAGSYHVVVRCADHILADGPTTLAMTDRDLDGLLWKVDGGCGLTVRVVDEAGSPLPGVRFRLTWPTQDGRAPRSVQYITDATGRYEFAHNLYPGTYTLAPDRGYEGAQTTVALHAATDKVDAILRLAGQGVILVNVQAPGGQPIDDVLVRAYADATAPGVSAVVPTVVSSAAAHRYLPAVPLGGGHFRIGPIAPGRYHVALADGVNGFRDAANNVIDVEPSSPATTTVVLDRGASVRGRVVDDQGQPVPDVWVEAKCNGTGSDRTPGAMQTAMLVRASVQAHGAITDGDGHFVLDGLEPTGTCLVRAGAPPAGMSTQDGVVPGTAIEIRLPSSSLSTQVNEP